MVSVKCFTVYLYGVGTPKSGLNGRPLLEHIHPGEQDKGTIAAAAIPILLLAAIGRLAGQ